MRSFLSRAGLFCSIQLIVGALLIWNAFQQPQIGYMAAFDDKIQLLENHIEPHVIIVGGSNAAFGFDSTKLQQEFEMPVINAGLHAALGLDFCLDVAQRYSRPGDIILLAPEWDLLAGTFSARTPQMQQLIRQSPNAWTFIHNEKDLTIKSFLEQRALGELAHIVQTGTKIHTKKKQEQKNIIYSEPGKYSRLNFNQQGDFVGHHQLGTIVDIENLEASFHFPEKQLNTAIAKLNQCAKRLEENQSRMYLLYPPVPTPFFKIASSRFAQTHNRLEAELSFPILYLPEDVNFPESQFFDTCYHLNLEGKTKRTELVTRSLRKMLIANQADGTTTFR